MKGRRRTGSVFCGYAVLFTTIAAVTTVAVLLYGFVDEKSGGNNRVVSLIMLAAIVVLALICTAIDYFRRKYTVDKPVEKILEATDKIASGDFSVRLEIEHPYPRYNEYDSIMENLNKMAEELAGTEVLRSDFISNVSHELKTPLAVIRSYALLLRTDLDAETRQKYADVLVSASERLTGLVVNILKLNKLENSTMTDFETFSLDELLADTVLTFEEKIDEKHLELFCDFSEVKIRSSRSYLEIVFSNLLSNAVKFTPDGGRIDVTLQEKDGRAIIEVKDTGVGMSAETGKHIFDKFFQGDTSRASEGNGLGLALVKRVIDILGGEIKVESELKKGSTFSVFLNGTVS